MLGALDEARHLAVMHLSTAVITPSLAETA